MRTLRSQHTYVPLDRHNETPTGKSVTVPDETFTIEEILRRSQQGLNAEVMHNGEYTLDLNSEDFDSHDVEKLKLLDPYDREMLARHLKAENEKHRQYLEDYQKQKEASDAIEAQKQEDARFAAYEKRMAAAKGKAASNDAKGGTTDS